MESKKAQNLSITTIILIILGLVVLVVLIIGFTKGWGSVKEFFTGGTTETQQVSTLCNLACTTEDTEAWCTQERVGGTCDDLAAQGKFVDCVAIICPTEECGDQPGLQGPAQVCDTGLNKMCPQDSAGNNQYVVGTFSDITSGEVCCQAECVNRPLE